MTNRARYAKAPSGRAEIAVNPGLGIATESAGIWAKRAGQFERQAETMLRASEQCLEMAEAIRKAKGLSEDEKRDFRPARRKFRRGAL